MSETTQATSGAESATSGAVKTDDSKPATTSGVNGAEQTYPKSHVEKILKEKGNQSAKIKELEEKLQTIQDSKLEQNQEFKTLAEQRLTTIKELEAKNKADDELKIKPKK